MSTPVPILPFNFGAETIQEANSVVHAVLSEEIETTLRCMGVTSLDQLNPSFVNTKLLELELQDRLWNPEQLGSEGYGESWVRGLKAKL